MTNVLFDQAAQPGFESLRSNEVDPAAEDTLQKRFQVHVAVKRLLLKFDEEVEIADLAGLCQGKAFDKQLSVVYLTIRLANQVDRYA